MNYKLDTDEQVFFYEQDFYVLSNFSAFRLSIWHEDFDTAEHAYHFAKFCSVNLDIANAVKTARSAHVAFKIAQANAEHVRKDWVEVREFLMLDILRAKVDQHEYVRRKLLATGNRELVEDSWRDSFWGWGPDKTGVNMLGKLWMKVRDEIRSEASTD